MRRDRKGGRRRARKAPRPARTQRTFRPLGIETLEQRSLLNGTPLLLGPETRVNTSVAGTQRDSDVAMDAAGNYVVAWFHDGDSGESILARLFDAQGVPQGDEFQVNTSNSDVNSLSTPAVAMDDDGDFVVVWNAEGSYYYGSGSSSAAFDKVRAQRFNALGVKQGAEFAVNPAGDVQHNPDVAMDASGDFVVAWDENYPYTSFADIYFKRFNAAGAPQGLPTKVNTIGAPDMDSFAPAVAIDDDGDFVVAFDRNSGSGYQPGIFARRFNESGVPQSAMEFQVDDGVTSDDVVRNPAVGMDASGDFVVAWAEEEPPLGSSYFDIRARRYSAAGVPQDVPGMPGVSEFLVNTDTDDSQLTPAVAMNGAGQFLIAWSGDDPGGGATFDIYAQHYEPDGSRDGVEFEIPTTENGDQLRPSAAINDNNNFIVTWDGKGEQPGQIDSQGVFAQRLTSCDLVVTTIADVVDPADNVNSLREAINCANASLGPDTITFSIPRPFTNGLVSWWRGEANAGDIVDGNHGSLDQGANAMAIGRYGQAFGFDGVNDGVSLPNTATGNLDITGNQLSIDAWVNTTDYRIGGTNQPIFDKYFDTVPNGYGLTLMEGRPGLRVITATGGDFFLVAANPVPLSTWTHVAGTYDGAVARVYVNGVEVASAPLSGNVLHSNFDAEIGNDNNPALDNASFIGRIDEVGVFNRALTPTEVQAIATGPRTISPTSALPTITDPVIIDGYSQPGSSANTLAIGNDAVLLIELNGNNVQSNALVVNSGGSTVRGLVINRFSGNAIVLQTAGGNTLTGNWMGVSPAGTVLQQNARDLFISGSLNNQIGGTTPAARNVFAGSASNGSITVFTGGSATIQGNYVGMNAQGTSGIGAAGGIGLTTSGNLVGGTAPGAGNVISGTNGLSISASNNTIQGNTIGLNAAGTATLANNFGGVSINSTSTTADNNLIGGSTAAARNVIANTGPGIFVNGAVGVTVGNTIQGNYVGTNVAGTAAAGPPFSGSGSSVGIRITGGKNNLITSNVIANYNVGLRIESATNANNTVQGNFIGTNAAGTAAIPNGTGIDIAVSAAASGNLIGGSTPAARNVISGNTFEGIVIATSGSLTTVQGNYIGVAADGVTALPNLGDGVEIRGSNNTIGGTAAGAANLIANNGGDGVFVNNGTGNAVSSNAIFSNTGLGIDLGTDGVTPNDAGDPDSGANRLQNFPVIDSVTPNGSQLTITYRVDTATGNATYPLRVEFFRADAAGQEGQTFLGFDTYLSAEAQTTKTFAFTPAVAVAVGELIVGTATDAAGNTSEFSLNAQAQSSLDFGDAPNSYFTTLAAGGNGGARHSATGVLLGTNRDTEADASTPLDGSGDDTTGAPDDEDGVTALGMGFKLLAGTMGSATVTINGGGGNARLFAWIDFNRDGTFDDPGEQVSDGTTLLADGAQNVNFSVPASASAGNTFARFRVCTQGGLSFDGAASEGEVEDYALQICSTIVTTTSDVVDANDSVNSLREAIDCANTFPGTQTISFAIPGGGVKTITPLSALPTITDPVIIDGYTQPGAVMNTSPNAFNGTLLIVLSGANAGPGTHGLVVTTANSTIRGLVINAFTLHGIHITGAGASGNTVTGNLLGTNAAGTAAVPNQHGVVIFGGATNNRVGTNGDNVQDAAERNVISGNLNQGVFLDGVGTEQNWVAGNLIGTSASGTTFVRNGFSGVLIRNGASRNRVGTNADGIADAAERNVLSGNGEHGVTIISNGPGSDENIVAGNYIGTDVTGTLSVGNLQRGVAVSTLSNRNIIGTNGDGINDVVERNIISGNLTRGVTLTGNNNVVAGNFIGTDVSGTLPLANLTDGILVTGGGLNNRIGTNSDGTSDALEANRIVASGGNGISILGAGTTGTLIRGNVIGMPGAGLGNVGHGISVAKPGNTIGGTAPGAGNTIAHNGGDGIFIADATAVNNSILANSIHSNGGLGIDLLADGATSNDLNDADSGANNLQNFPLITSLTRSGGMTTINGKLQSTPNMLFRVELFESAASDPSGHGEGQSFLGIVPGGVMTDGTGNAIFSVTFATPLGGTFISATATDPTGNTSEFACSLVVTTTADSGTGSLRAAIDCANENPGQDIITFAIPGAGVHTISPLSALPVISDPVIIDGYSQPGSSANTLAIGNDAVLLIELNGTSAGAAHGLSITAGGSTVRGLVINRFAANGILLSTSGSNQITGNFIGTNAAGTTDLGNTQYGVSITGGTANIVGTNGDNLADAGERNIISGNNLAGVLISGAGTNSNVVAGNYIGTDLSGTAALGNGTPGTVPPATSPGALDHQGVRISGGAQFNRIGTDANGVADTAERNLISGNVLGGVVISGSGTNSNIIAGNFIGTNVGGTAALGNGTVGMSSNFDNQGVKIIADANSNRVEGNLISGNIADGIKVFGADLNIVSNNLIGTDVTGTLAVGNLRLGVNISQDAVSNEFRSNVISGNINNGVSLDHPNARLNVIADNKIGTDITGNFALGNLIGLSLFEGSNNFVERNVLSGNRSSGVNIGGNSSQSQTVLSGNFIGTNAAGDSPLGNASRGVRVARGLNLQIGTGPLLQSDGSPSVGNVIAFNATTGVVVEELVGPASGIRIQGNSIYSNGALGIDLGNNGVTPNDAGDSDAGANNLQNFPLITSLTRSGGMTTINGKLHSTPNTLSRVELFESAASDPSGHGEGQSFLGIVPGGVMTDGAGNATFSATFATPLGGTFISATATDPTGNTSEFACSLVVTTTADSGTGSLRAAIDCANENPGLDIITFAIPGAGVHTISPLSALPVISDPVIIDGYSQPGSSANTLAIGNDAVLLIELDGTGASTSANGLDLATHDSTVRGLVINRFEASGIRLESDGLPGLDNNVIEGNFIGLDPTGTLELGNHSHGVEISDSSGNRIGGNTPAARNLISGNDETGIGMFNSSGSNSVLGNYIGTDRTGTVGLGNSSTGVLVVSIEGNNTIGGSMAADRNIISDNQSAGVEIANSAGPNLVLGNYIGTDVTGTVDLGNGGSGVIVGPSAPNVRIGGMAAGEGNLLSGNNSHGIFIGQTSQALVQGNRIGTDVSGLLPLGNSEVGVFILDASQNTIGGTTAAARNIISANESQGILLSGALTFLNTIQGNFIGTDITGTGALGNDSKGVFIEQGAADNTIGGTVPRSGNTIAYNDGVGIAAEFDAGNGNSFLGNSIFSNVGIGIDLNFDFVTDNDLNDADSGPNNLQNFPVLTSISEVGGNTRIQGFLNSGSDTQFRVEFFLNDAADDSGFGEGQTFLGFVDVISGGTATIDVVFPGLLPAGSVVTATATDPFGNTSEFSAAVQRLDFGDAPDSYGTALGSDGARHVPADTLLLGFQRDEEFDAELPLDGSGDDSNGGEDDEDGVSFASNMLFAGDMDSVDVEIDGSSDDARLYGWIDFNRDGDFNDAGEQISDGSVEFDDGTHTIDFQVPANASPGTSYARFRVSTQAGLSFDGPAVDGEVEDYAIQICSLIVTTNLDILDPTDHLNSLREAILCANAHLGADTITLPADTYTLAIAGTGENLGLTGDLDITDHLTINGAGAATTIVDGNDLDRVFHIRSLPAINAAFSGLTIRNGQTTSRGGGILQGIVGGTLTIRNSVISGNESAMGGGISTDAAVTIEDSTISGNSAIDAGGGIEIYGGSLTLRRSTIDSNHALDDESLGHGGGIYVNDTSGPLTIERSTISRNTAVANGGGIQLDAVDHPVLIVNSTISGNSARSGGGMYVDQFTFGDSLTIQFSTIANNTASLEGGGLYEDDESVVLKNTIVANNSAGADGQDVYSLDDALFVEYSLIENVGGGNIIETAPGTNVFGRDPLLAALLNNGGPTETHALLAGSPALNTANPATFAPIDQRGVARPQGPAPDMGAFESETFSQLFLSIDDVTIDEENSGTTNAVFTVTLSGPTSAIVIVFFDTANGSATAGSDFLATSGTLAFAPLQTRQFVTVVVNGDTESEPNETFHVNLSSPFNATIADGQGIGTIVDDDEDDARPIFVTGADAGGGPHVKVFDASTSQLLFGFMAYDPRFGGGVRVAVGDVNGDGTDDIVTGAGPGGGPHVRVFDGRSGAQLPGLIGSFMAYDPRFSGGVYVAAGDVNGDGAAEVITGADAGGGPHVRVFDGRTGAQLVGRIGSFFAYKAEFDAGVRVAAGDVDGDGRADVITGMGPGYGDDTERSGFRNLAQPEVRVYSGASGIAIYSFDPFEAGYRGGVHLAVVHFDADERVEIIVGKANGDGRTDAAFNRVHIDPFRRSEFSLFQASGSAIIERLNESDAYSFYGGSVRVAAVDQIFRDAPDFDPSSDYLGPVLISGAGPGGGPHVKLRTSNLALIDQFFAYDENFSGGVFVAGSVADPE